MAKQHLISFSLLTAAVLGGWLASSTTAQDRVSSTEQMLTSLGQRCNRATEVSYRSSRIRTPDGVTEVYVEGLLRKIVNPDSSLRQVIR